jgi:site-specific DNA-methyltransferase (adenine-specific)
MNLKEWVNKNKLNNSFINCNCMDLMKEFPNKIIDLAIVDPPFFSGPNKKNYYRGGNSKKYNTAYKDICSWETPKQNYFDELLRVSKNQIIWGINYYNINYLGTGRIIWDKKNDIPGNSFSDCEIAYCSLFHHVRIFRYLWSGFRQENMKNKEKKIHPTQKPLELYRWILKNYAEEGNIILDTHVGSGSSIIACIEFGFKYIGCELDNDYYNKAQKRINDSYNELENSLGLINYTKINKKEKIRSLFK